MSARQMIDWLDGLPEGTVILVPHLGLEVPAMRMPQADVQEFVDVLEADYADEGAELHGVSMWVMAGAEDVIHAGELAADALYRRRHPLPVLRRGWPA